MVDVRLDGVDVLSESEYVFMHRMIAMLGACMAIAATANAIARTWDGGAGNFLWSSPANWNPDGVPQASDDVIIDVPEEITVVYGSADATIRSIDCQETLTITGS